MKRLLIVPLILILFCAYTTIGQAEAEDDFTWVSKDSEEGFLGVYLDDLTTKIADKKGYEGTAGVYISGIVDDSPADDAGLKKGDIVIEAGGKIVLDSDDLTEIIESTGEDNELTLKVFRKGEEISLTATLTSEPGFNIKVGKHALSFVPGIEGGKLAGFYSYDRGHLGVKVQDLNKQLAEYFKVDEGVLITETEKDRPAEKAGLKAGDIIISIAGKDVDDYEELIDELGEFEDGDKVEVGYVRDGKKKSVQVVLDDPMAKYYTYRGYLGVYLQDLNDQLKEYFNVDEGVLITKVVEDSPAEKAGIKAGDVVISIGGKEVEDSGELTKAVRKHDPGDKVDIVLMRDKKQKTIKVELGKTKEKKWKFDLFGLSGDNDWISVQAHPKVIIEDIEGLKELQELEKKMKEIQIEVSPDIKIRCTDENDFILQDFDHQLLAKAKYLQARATALRSKLSCLRKADLHRHMNMGTQQIKALMDNLKPAIEEINVQLDKLREELRNLEIQQYLRERM